MAPSTPMPTPTVPQRPFHTFKALSFDIYGTIIDWETGISTALKPLLTRLSSAPNSSHHTTDSLASLLHSHERTLQTEHPGMHYTALLSEAYLRTANALDLSSASTAAALQDEASAFGHSVGDWPPFPDSIAALQALGRRYKLIALSNTDHAAFGSTLKKALKGEVHFDAQYLAEDIGSYKPDVRNFEYLLEGCRREFEVEEEGVLVVARSLFHDHGPAKKMRLSSVWVDRGGAMGGDAEKMVGEGDVGFGWRVESLGELVERIEMEEAGGEKR